MSNKTTPAEAAKNDKAPDAKKLVVRVKVIKGGLSIAGSTAAAGTVINCFSDIADFHEKRGEVKILGT
jgi:hypothetical protein